MYNPKFTQVSERSLLYALIEKQRFGHWSSLSSEGLEVNSIPFVLDKTQGVLGTLSGHVAIANPIWKTCDVHCESVIVFEDGHAYVSPSYYPSKKTQPKVVPTWNYKMVQVRGTVQFIHDRAWLTDHVTKLTEANELGREEVWSVSDAPPSYIVKMLGAIVGVEIQISDIFGKWKLSQNRSLSDQRGVAQALNGHSERIDRYEEKMIAQAMFDNEDLQLDPK